MSDKKTAIVTGASQGIGAGVVAAFLQAGYNVVATSRDVSQSLTASPSLVLVDGDIGKQETAAKVVEAAIKLFGPIDVLVSNAGIFLTKPFTDFTTDDFNVLVSTNLLGISLHHSARRETDAEAEIGERCDHFCGVCRPAHRRGKWLGFDDYEGGLNAVTRNLAIEYANEGIRFNAVAPGPVDPPMHKGDPKNSTSQPMMKMATVKDVVDAVLYLAEAGHVSGEVLHVDGAAPARRW